MAFCAVCYESTMIGNTSSHKQTNKQKDLFFPFLLLWVALHLAHIFHGAKGGWRHDRQWENRGQKLHIGSSSIFDFGVLAQTWGHRLLKWDKEVSEQVSAVEVHKNPKRAYHSILRKHACRQQAPAISNTRTGLQQVWHVFNVVCLLAVPLTLLFQIIKLKE